ncbi:MAG: hypothetical protein ABMA01_10760 [Chthoniobacteraceae bacterium]
MNRNAHRSLRGARPLALLFFCIGTVAVHACSIPVFRYALDRWPADRLQLEVSPADAQKEDVAKYLRNFTDSTPLNLSVVRSKDAAASRLSYPHAEASAVSPWSGSLDAAALAQITDSPARAEIVRRTLAGDSTVWVLVESGKKEDDDRAAASIEKRLRYLEQASQLPPIDPNDPSSKLGPGPALGVKFSLVRIRHDDPAEQVFVKMLAGPKATEAPSKGPWFAAVFGRGRTLGAWPAEGFGDEQIEEVCSFLLGACSCEVKRLNPGWDLLVTADWDEQLRLAEETRLAAPVAEGQAAPQRATAVVPETVTFNPPAPPLPPVKDTGKKKSMLPMLAAAVGLLALVVLLAKLRFTRS